MLAEKKNRKKRRRLCGWDDSSGQFRQLFAVALTWSEFATDFLVIFLRFQLSFQSLDMSAAHL